jgi:membrane protein DedA with SNARE-associated domain
VLGPIVGWLHEHLYAVVFLGAILDAVGIPFPGRLMLITAGSYSHPESATGSSALVVIALASMGMVAGDHVWYLAGRFKGHRLFEIYCRVFRLSESHRIDADRILRRFGSLALVLVRLAATLRLLVVPLAVSRGMTYRRFVVADAIGATVWATGFVWLGRAVGAVAQDAGVGITLTVISVVVTGSAALSLLARRRFAVGGIVP